MADLAVVILTYNEELHIERAIRSVAGIAREVIVVDSYSTDSTLALATSLGARVLQNPFVNQAKQFQWALENAGVESAWIMRLDADEIIEPALAEEIECQLPLLSPEIAGVNLKRRHIFMGRWIRHGGRYPLILMRIWRRGAGRVEDRWMDEHVVLDWGRTTTFSGNFSDLNLHDLSFFTEKHNKYATREAIQVISQRRGFGGEAKGLDAKATSRQAAFKRWLKETVYGVIPFYVSASLYFLYRYIGLGGFLDGREGLIYHGLQGLWYRFLVGAKVMEFERALASFKDPAECAAELSRLTGYRLNDVAPEQRLKR